MVEPIANESKMEEPPPRRMPSNTEQPLPMVNIDLNETLDPKLTRSNTLMLSPSLMPPRIDTLLPIEAQSKIDASDPK
jgi:hypothetical protein